MNQVFIPQAGRRPFKDMAELRDALMSAPLGELEVVDAQDADAARMERHLIVCAIQQVRDGACFDFGHLDLDDETFDGSGFADSGAAAMAAMAEGALGLPYPVFTSLVRLSIPGSDFDSFVMLVAMDAGAGSLVFYPTGPMVNEIGGTDFVPLPCSGRLTFGDDGAMWLEPATNATEHDRAILNAMLRLLFFQLGLLADDRVPLDPVEAPAQLNKARRARGRPVIPARWRVDATSWVTKVSGQRAGRGERRGGSHRSPIAHDRRGHQRRLPSGRITWVRPSRIGEMMKHMTRHRAFYELSKGDGQ